MNTVIPTQDLLRIVDFVENFDEKGIGLALLIPPIRSGTVLLHSLLDNHPQILHLPINFRYFLDWEYVFKTSTPDALIHDFFTKSLALAPRVTQLGPHQNETLDLKFPEIIQLMKAVKPYLSALDRKKLLLLFHAAYAHVFSINLENIKTILIDHHLLSNIFGYFTYVVAREGVIQEADLNAVLALTPTQYRESQDQILEAIFSDFPQAKFLLPIRSPMAACFAGEKYFLSFPNKAHDLALYYIFSFNGLLQYYNAYALTEKLGPSVHLIKFEELHNQTEAVMRQLAAYLGIDYHPCLLETTLGGRLWSGAGATRDNQVVIGTGPHHLEKETVWQQQWPPENIALFAQLSNPLAVAFGYSPIKVKGPAHPLDNFLPLEVEIYVQYVPKLCSLFEQSLAPHYSALSNVTQPQDALRHKVSEQIHLFNQKLLFWNNYPRFRAQIIQTLVQCSKEVD